jgi:hypothetical protein
MNQKLILFKIKSFFVVLIFLIFTNPSIAQADAANPPKVQSIKMLNPEKIYKVGDVVTFSIKYSGGNPGLKRVDLWVQNQVQGKGIGDYCLIGDPWFSLWGDKPSNYGLPIGPITTTEILMYKYVSANCVKGINEVRLSARLADLTDLESNYTGDDLFKFSVLDGLWIPPGEVLGNRIDTTFNLDFLPSEVVLEQGKSFEIKLPTRTSEGVPVFYQPWPGDVCFISQEPAFPWFQPKVEWSTVIEFKKPGTCSLTSGNATLYRSTIKDFVFKKEIKVVSKLERDKEISDAKAAVELKAKQEAEAKAIADKAAAEANRREQTISVSPFISGPIPLRASGLLVKVSSSSNLSVFAYNSTNNVCEYANGIVKTKASGRCVIAFSQEGNSEYKPAGNLILDFTLFSEVKKTTINCVKGKLTKKVTAVKPKCPAGYKVKK